MIDHIHLIGGPADGRRMTVKAGLDPLTVFANVRPDPAKSRRRTTRLKCRYRRTEGGVGTGLIPRRYEFTA